MLVVIKCLSKVRWTEENIKTYSVETHIAQKLVAASVVSAYACFNIVLPVLRET